MCRMRAIGDGVWHAGAVIGIADRWRANGCATDYQEQGVGRAPWEEHGDASTARPARAVPFQNLATFAHALARAAVRGGTTSAPAPSATCPSVRSHRGEASRVRRGPMCGCCDGEASLPLIGGHTCCRLGMHVNDVVRVQAAPGAKKRIGYFEEIDAKWGVAIIYEDGSRTWYPYRSLDCDVSSGWSIELANVEDFIRADNFALAPKEHGRGWLPRPPPSASAPRIMTAVRTAEGAGATTLLSHTSDAMAFDLCMLAGDDELDGTQDDVQIL